MNCIKCRGRLKQTQGQSTFMWCTLCKGLWLDKEALLKIFKGHVKIKEIISQELEDSIKISKGCPQCQSSLRNGKIPETQIIVEACDSCEKYFFDDKEINQLLEYIQHSDMPKGRDIDWSTKKLEQSKQNCPVCEIEPLFGIHGEMDKVGVCLKCNGVATRVDVLQRMVGRSLFGPTMFEFRRGGSIVAYCRFCHQPQERKNSECIYCHREIKGIDCHDCDSRMSEYELNHVVIDRCQICNAIWLDSGEFEKVMTITPDVKKFIDREILTGKLSAVRTDAISQVYSQAIEESRRDMVIKFWGPLLGTIFFY